MYEMVGTIVVSDGRVDVTDPCYSKDVWCRTTLNVKPGTYRCYVEKVNYGPFGKRNGRIAIIHNSLSKFPDLRSRKTSVAHIGVDAGLAGFFVDKPDFNDEEWNEFCERLWERDKMNKVHYYFDKFNNSKDYNAFYSESGCGDGSYPVDTFENAEGETVGLLLDFA